MKRINKYRILSLFLAILMIFTALPVISVGAIESYSADDYAANVEAVAMFNTNSPYDVLLCDHPDNFNWNIVIPNADIPSDLKLVIKDYYINANDQLFYKVEAAPGYTLPEILSQYPWIYQNNLGMDEEYDALIIVKPADKEIVLEDSKTGVTVTGYIPDGVELNVAGVSNDKLNAVSNGLIDKSGFSEILSVSGKDITLLDGNSEMPWHPGAERPVTVTVSDVWTPAGKALPVVDVYHILDDAQAVEKAQSGGYLRTCTDPAVLSLYSQEATLLDGTAVPYVRLPGIDGGAAVNQDGSITFQTDSFSDYFIVLGFTDGLSLSNNGSDTYYVEPGTTLTFNRSVTWTHQGTVPAGITASGETITISNDTAIPSEVTYKASWTTSSWLGGSTSNTATVTIKVSTRAQIVSGALKDEKYPVILSVVQDITTIPSEPGHTSGKFFKFYNNYTVTSSLLTYPKFSPSAEEIISPNISDVLIKSIDGTNTIGYADATGATILSYLSGIEWDRILDQAVNQGWKAIDDKTITDDNKSLYKIVPYVIKLMDGSTLSGKGWHIDCAIVLKDNVTLSYDINLDNYQVSGTSKLTLPNTASGILNPNFNTDVGSITYGSTNLNVDSAINATYNGEQMTLTFKGWNTSPDGKGKSYAPGDYISISEDTVLYAIWEGALVPGELYIYKEVTADDGAAEPSGATYQFSIKFGTQGTYNYTVYNANGSTVSTGSLETQGGIELANEQYAAFTGIPANTTYEVTESEGSYTTTSEGDSGIVRSGGRAVARFVNHYEKEPEVTINYIAKDGGRVTLVSETVKENTGIVQGSTATANEGYRFVGWYLDSNCEKPVPNDWVDVSGKITPQKFGESWTAATYYAKFEYNLTSLTIKKQGHDSIDENQTFLFKLTDADGLELTVTVHGNGSVTVDGLTVGKEYNIVEISEWSWRYTNKGVIKGETTVNIKTSVNNGAEFTLNPTNNVITFTNERSNPYWLDGDSWCNNIFN